MSSSVGLTKTLKMKRLQSESFGENEDLFFLAPYIITLASIPRTSFKGFLIKLEYAKSIIVQCKLNIMPFVERLSHKSFRVKSFRSKILLVFFETASKKLTSPPSPARPASGS